MGLGLAAALAAVAAVRSTGLHRLRWSRRKRSCQSDTAARHCAKQYWPHHKQTSRRRSQKCGPQAKPTGPLENRHRDYTI